MARGIFPTSVSFARPTGQLSFWPICTYITDCVTTNSWCRQYHGSRRHIASSPLMAGMMALLDQIKKGGRAIPISRCISSPQRFRAVFHDVTIGNNNVPCSPGTPNCTLDSNGDGYYTLQSYNAAAGYDLASGLGSVDAYQMITNWNKITFTSTTTSLASLPRRSSMELRLPSLPR